MWERFTKYLYNNPDLGLMMDISRMNFKEGFLSDMEGRMQKTFKDMAALENGVIANPDEGRMVGHYWLRNSAIAPDDLRSEVEGTLSDIKSFARDVHSGKVSAQNGRPFKNVLVVGIGGSALGPQFVSAALGGKADKMRLYFFDNTDPDGIDLVLDEIGDGLGETLTLVISKSGGTIETRNGMLEAARAYDRKGLRFASHVAAVTGKGSKLDQIAEKEGWIRRFPMWDWVGGRTSVTSAVGMLPAALQGLDIDRLCEGAKRCDEATRRADTLSNPGAILALMWYYATGGCGNRDMVILPYKDRLGLFTKYLQQLIMESLGKEKDIDGKLVNQGITVYGNKGTTDQHAYIQQLRDGVNNFFVTFIETLVDRNEKSMDVDEGVTTGDYLSAFFLGTRDALYASGRESVTITIGRIDPFSIGVLIALYERAVGLYATLININAYHQPGVEAGKKAASAVIFLQSQLVEFLRKNKGARYTASELASGLSRTGDTEAAYKILMHLSGNPDRGIKMEGNGDPLASRFYSI